MKIVGVWIDHRKAIIVGLGYNGDDVLEIPSNMEKHVRFSGESGGDSTESQTDGQVTGHQKLYYDKVASCLNSAESIMIFGTSGSKREFEKHLLAGYLGARCVDIEVVGPAMYHEVVGNLRGRLLISIENLHQDNSN